MSIDNEMVGYDAVAAVAAGNSDVDRINAGSFIKKYCINHFNISTYTETNVRPNVSRLTIRTHRPFRV